MWASVRAPHGRERSGGWRQVSCGEGGRSSARFLPCQPRGRAGHGLKSGSRLIDVACRELFLAGRAENVEIVAISQAGGGGAPQIW